MALRSCRASPFLDAMFPAREQKWIRLNHRAEVPATDRPAIKLQDFSFLLNPEATLDAFTAIAESETRDRAALINFDDEYCLDVAPYMLLAEFWHDMLPVFEGGRMSRAVQKVLVKVGLRQALNIYLRGVDNLDGVWAFPLSRRRSFGKSASTNRLLDAQTREYVADRFSDTLDEWLGQKDIGLELAPEGRGWIKNIFGELLENAERHSDGERRDGTWSVAGFIARRQGENEGEFNYRCYLGFVSLGDTFSESMARALPDVHEEMETYIDGCRANGCALSSETLQTVFAIQDTVTSVREADVSDRGGYGLQEMLELVSMLGFTQQASLQPRVTIISGHSCISLKAPYIVGRRMRGQGSPRVLWFNPANSSKVPPDERHVRDLTKRVPGTVISIGFTLDPEILKGASGGTDQPS